jgi:hypothetical protein
VARKVFDSQGVGGYSPLDFPPYGRFVLGFLETGRKGGGVALKNLVEIDREDR